METMSVAPLPGPVLPQPASPTQASDEGAKPFEQALKEELAKPESEKAESTKSEEAKKAEPEKAAEAPRSKEPVRASEWAALLERAGLTGEVEAASEDDVSESGELASAGAAEAATEALVAPETEPSPLHPLLSTPASARTADTALALDKQQSAAAVHTRAKTEPLDTLAARATEAEDVRGGSAKADAASEALLASFAERVSTSETASTARSPALDGLASTVAARWAGGQPTAANGAAAQTPVTARIDTPLGASGWGEAFQQKIVWLVDRQQQSAELHINPPHLGPVEVSLNISEDGTRIAFSSPHAAVREAIEASLADLKTALGEKGLSLGQATVGADSQAAREQLQGESRTGATGNRNGGTGDVPADLPLPPRAVQRGLVDIFA